MQELIKKAKLNIDSVIKDSNDSWTMDDDIIVRKKEKNFSNLSCSCESCTWSNNKGMCYKKIAVILFESDNNFHVRVNQMIREYEQSKELGIEMSPDSMIEDLTTLKFLK